jgi:hypothetical protein
MVIKSKIHSNLKTPSKPTKLEKAVNYIITEIFDNKKLKDLFIDIISNCYEIEYFKRNTRKYKNREEIYMIANKASIAFLDKLISSKSKRFKYYQKNNIFLSDKLTTKFNRNLNILCKELEKDKDQGSFYHSYQSNIAMPFVDAYYNNKKKWGISNNLNKKMIMAVADNAAQQFIYNFIR